MRNTLLAPHAHGDARIRVSLNLFDSARQVLGKLFTPGFESALRNGVAHFLYQIQIKM
jgi:hypothetical protein